MKQPVAFLRWRPFLVMMFFSLVSLAIWGQEETSERGSEINPANSVVAGPQSPAWYASPWLWLIGAAVLVLLLVAIFSNGKKEKIRAPKIQGSNPSSTIPTVN